MYLGCEREVTLLNSLRRSVSVLSDVRDIITTCVVGQKVAGRAVGRSDDGVAAGVPGCLGGIESD